MVELVLCDICGGAFHEADLYPYGDYGEERICGDCYGDEYLQGWERDEERAALAEATGEKGDGR